MIFVNFKTYEQGTGEKAVALAKICQEVEKETSVKIIPVVQAADIYRLAHQGFEVWAQHLDNIEYGQNTGQILPEAVLTAGAKGTLLNHSENKLPLEVIKETIEKVQNLKFKVLVCAESVEEGAEIAKFCNAELDFLAYEPPELIGSQISVSLAKPEIIRDFTAQIQLVPVIIGAGVQNQNDIQKGLQLGAKGFLVANSVMLTNKPKEKLLELAGGFALR